MNVMLLITLCAFNSHLMTTEQWPDLPLVPDRLEEDPLDYAKTTGILPSDELGRMCGIVTLFKAHKFLLGDRSDISLKDMAERFSHEQGMDMVQMAAAGAEIGLEAQALSVEPKFFFEREGAFILMLQNGNKTSHFVNIYSTGNGKTICYSDYPRIPSAEVSLEQLETFLAEEGYGVRNLPILNLKRSADVNDLKGAVRVEPPKLKITDAEITGLEEAQVKLSAKLVNESDLSFRVTSILKSCGCAGASVDKDLIEAGASASINVNLFVHAGMKRDVSLTVTDERGRSASMTIQVDIPHRLFAVPATIDFGNVLQKEHKTVTVDLFIEADAEITPVTLQPEAHSADGFATTASILEIGTARINSMNYVKYALDCKLDASLADSKGYARKVSIGLQDKRGKTAVFEIPLRFKVLPPAVDLRQ